MEKRTETRNVILFNYYEVMSLALALTVFIKQDRNATLVPVTPDNIDDWQTIEIEEQMGMEDYWSKKGAAIKTPDFSRPTRLYVVGMHPENEEDKVTIWQFIEKYGDQISLWIDNHDWPQSYLNNCRRIYPHLIVDPQHSPLEILFSLGYQFPSAWKDSERTLAHELYKVSSDHIAWRLGASLYYGITWENLYDDCYLMPSLFLAIGELIMDKEHPLVDEMVEHFQKMFDLTERARSKIEVSGNSRPIAYVDLGEIENLEDIPNILLQLGQDYPWLTVIRANGKTFAGSTILDLEKIQDLDNFNHEEILQMLKIEVEKF